MNAVDLDPLADPSWTSLVDAHDGHLFVSRPWLTALAATYGLHYRATALLDDTERARAAVCAAHVDDLSGPRLVSLPFSDFADPLTTDPASSMALLESLTRHGLPVHLRARSSSIPRIVPLRRTTTAKWHGVDLSGGLQELQAHFHPSARRAIRRATASGVEIEPRKDHEALRDFFDLHLRVRKRKHRLLAQPFSLLEALWEAFIQHDKGVLMLATHDGDVIAGTLYLHWGSSVYYKFNASDPARLELRPNDLLIAAGIEYAHARGATLLDFGLSDASQDGLLRFKRKFASHEEDIVTLQHLPEEWDATREQQVRALLHDLTRLLTEDGVPDHVTESAGSLLYRHFA